MLPAMCGIAGVLRVQDPREGLLPPREAIPEAWLDILDESIRHRGPDGQGRFRDRAVRPDGKVVDVALVHRRLAIIDLSARAAQPMVIERPDGHPSLTGAASASSREVAQEPTPAPFASGSHAPEAATLISREGGPYEPCRAHRCPKCKGLTAIVFNGCIYNHKELRKELQSVGHEFFTDHSDTEVLMHGWCEWGMDLRNRIDGMYALTVWMQDTAQLLWARDAAGEKPLYHNVIQGPDCPIVGVSTSVPGLLRLFEMGNPGSNHADKFPTGLPDWIAYGWDCIPPACIYENRPAQWRVRGPEPNHGGKRLSRRSIIYSGAKVDWPAERTTQSLSTENVDALFTKSVARRLETDVPLGCFLSGGIDSGLVASVAQKELSVLGAKLSTFSVRMPDARYDESRHASKVARHLGTSHTTLDVSPTPAEDVVRLIERLGLPLGDSSLLPTSWVCRAARSHVAVALGGDGADELFGGYSRYQGVALLRRHEKALRCLQVPIMPSKHPKSLSSKVYRLANAARGNHYFDLLAIFPQHLMRKLVVDPEHFDEKLRLRTDALREDFDNYLPDDLLRKVDTASMSVALEVRSPFLSRDLVEACLAAPLSSLMPNGQRKGLLKQVALKYLPPEIVNRPKQGFAIPIGDWFRTDYGQMRQLLYDHLESAEPFPNLPLELNMDFVRQMLKEHDEAGERSLNPWHGRDHSQRLYMLLVLSIWCKWLQGLRSE